MHTRGNPKTMKELNKYSDDNLISGIFNELEIILSNCRKAGMLE